MGAGLALASVPAHAQTAPQLSELALPLMLSAVLCGMGVILVVLRLRGRSHGRRAMKRIRVLEHDLAEAGALLNAEPQIMLVWKGKGEEPYRCLGEIRGLAGVPLAKDEQYRIEEWLDEASLDALSQRLTALRTDGTAFNINVSNLDGALLEADGRATGGMATLRIRALEGDRLLNAELQESLREAQLQFEQLTGLLHQLPVPIWLSQADGNPGFANQAYRDAVGDDGAAGGVAPAAALLGAPGRQSFDIIEARDGRGGLALGPDQLTSRGGDLDLHISAHTRALERLTTAVAIFGADQRLQFFNPAYVKLWKLDPDWLAAGPSDGDILEALREARRLPEQANFRTWKQEQLAVYGSDDVDDDWWHLPDGRTIRVIVEQHPSGGLAYIYEDVTERLDLESRYNALINVQKETLDHLHEGVALFGSDGRLKLYNPAYAEMWRLKPAMLDAEPHVGEVARWCMPLYDDEATWDELVWAVTAFTEDRRALSAQLRRPDDTAISFASVPLPDGATLLTYADVSAQTRIELALRERNDALETAGRMKTEFVSHVSRQLRLPLTSIIGFAESLSIGIAGELAPKQAEYIDDVLASSSQLLTLIDDILDLATIDAGRMELKLAPVDLKSVLKASAALVKTTLQEKNLRLQITVPGNAGSFIADERRVRQTIFNLLSNAAGFTPRGGEIKLGCKRTDGEILIWVRDSGPGMPREFQARAFERFETRTDGSGHRGAGLGLSIVKTFMELHGGSAVLHSNPGEGTMIECRYPLLALDGAEASSGGPDQTSHAAPDQTPDEFTEQRSSASSAG